MDKNPILITGIHRSGSTFTGKMLSLNKNVGYIQEPFNKDYGLKVFDTNFKYLTKSNYDVKYKSAIENLIALEKADYHIPSIIHKHQSVENKRALFDEVRKNLKLEYLRKLAERFFLRSGAQWAFYKAKYNPLVDRILIKDPLACLSSQFLYQQYNINVVVLVRHPLSFAGSLKRLGWDFNFDTFLKQPRLMEDHLSHFKDEMIRLNKNPGNTVERACLIWNCIYTVLSKYIKANPSFILFTHEEIAQHPVKSFKSLYDQLGLDYNEDADRKIKRHTSAKNSVKAKNNTAHQLNRDSAKLIYEWKNILTDEEINYVTQETSNIAAHFYKINYFENA